ncbi:hypothetical protein KXD40_006176 [Peronospora effusa]|uniref:HIT-type domain-containing protein n=1 Tax=Peronospora effusa TaxID=542832 RepID=A0A425C6Q7_9STRA|nr:hypothetical protein DD237_006120 [Peronospora effusa]UIZ25624.1 hypothetical protein KXD40_006176 [Peronospora effusa]
MSALSSIFSLMTDLNSSKRPFNDVETSIQLPLLEPSSTIVCCNECGKTNVKYRCPRCEYITCSLLCCVSHKKKFNCNGKRDRTKFIQIQKFTDANLSSDYFFLEEVSRSTNSAARSRSQLNANVRRYTSNKKRKGATDCDKTGPLSGLINPDVPADWLARFPVAVQMFAQYSAKRGVTLTLLAPGMSKRTRNSSYMDKKKNTMYWRVEWVFPSATVPVAHYEERADENNSLFALLRKYLTPTQENVAMRAKLKKYAVPDWEKHILLFLRKEFTPAMQPQYYRLNGKESLESNLKRKAVVEFPVIIVALGADADKYPIAHDVIEAIPSDANDQQPAAEEPEAMEIEDEGVNCKTSMELLTGNGTNILEKLVAVSDEESEKVETSVQHKGPLIEELEAAKSVLTRGDETTAICDE